MRLALRSPRLSFAVASALDAVSVGLGSGDGSFWRRGVVYIGMFHPSERWPFPDVMTGPDPMSLRPPMVLTTLHWGAVEAAGALLERLPADVLVFVDREVPKRSSVTPVALGEDQWQRAAATKLAIQTLRSGGFVFLAVDARHGSARIETTLLGEQVSWSRGGFDLARLTSSPMTPVMTRWRGRKIEIVAGEPIPPSEASLMAAALARWLESYLHEAG